MKIYYAERTLCREELFAALARAGLDCDFPLLATGNGKPYFAAPEAPKFNLTHTEGLTAVAVGDCEVGLDAERRTPRALHALIKKLSPREREEDFFKLWTAKESYIKFCGGTLASMLKRLAYFGGTLYENGVPVHAALRHFELCGCTLCLCTQSPVETEFVGTL